MESATTLAEEGDLTEEGEELRPRFELPRTPRSRGQRQAGAGLGAVALSWALVAVLAWAPLPLGSNRPWSWSLLAILVGMLLLLVTPLALQGRIRVRTSVAIWLAAALITPVIGWIVAQALLGTSAPLAHPIWGEVATHGFPGSPAASVDPSMTWEALLRVTTAIAIFVLALVAAQDESIANRLGLGFVSIATVYALYGLLRFSFGWDVLIWEVETDVDVTSTFVNRNHFATYANLAVLVALSTLVKPFFKSDSVSWRQTGLDLVKHAFEKNGLLLTALVVLVVASLLSGSRGGFISLAFAVVFLVVAAMLKGRPRGLRAAGVVALVAIAGLGFLELAGQRTLERLATISSDTDVDGRGRLAVWDMALDALDERPLLGHGYGTFESTFMLHRDERFELIYDFAHSTYLEDAVGLGLPAAIAWYVGVLCLFLYCVRGFAVRRRHQACPLTAAAATVLVGVHALLDFSIQIPAVAVTYAAILGIGCAQAHRRSSGRAANSPARPNLFGPDMDEEMASISQPKRPRGRMGSTKPATWAEPRSKATSSCLVPGIDDLKTRQSH